MKQPRHVITAIKIWPIVCLLMLMGVTHRQPAWGAGPPGLSINLYLKPDGADGNVPLGEPIEILMVVKNETAAELITERDFDQKEFYFSLVLVYTDQFDKIQVFTLAEEELHAMMTAFYVAGRPMVQASTLPNGWAKSITIKDIRELFPILKTKPGSYILKAELPFLRFQWGFELVPIGQLGAADHPDNFSGILVSNEIPIEVSPDRGAQVDVRVISNANFTSAPISQLEVKIFKKADLPEDYSLADIFTKLDPVLAGTTNFDGQADWYSGSRCLVDDDYTIIADNNGDFGQASIARDTEAGWQIACTGLVEKEILFGPPPRRSSMIW